MSKKIDIDFIKESLNKENYTFLDEAYVDARTKFNYRCNNGHTHAIKWSEWKTGHRCPFCSGNAKLTINQIREDFKSAGFLLLDTEYVNSKQRFNYVCSKGHKHSMRIDHLRRGICCPHCSGVIKKSLNEVRQTLAKENYILLSDKYENVHGKLSIKCSSGHVYEASFHGWLNGHRCPVCNGGVRLEYAAVKNTIEEDGYALLTDAYVNCSQHLKTLCPSGHEYSVNFNNWKHKNSRCVKCSGNGSSGQEIILRDYLTKNNIVFETNNKSLIYPYELDIVIPDKQIAIECCGLYWHSEKHGKDRKYHLNKLEKCILVGYRLITIFEDELLYNKNIVFSRLNNIIGINNNTKRVCGRKCVIKNIDVGSAKIFCGAHHLQGYVGGCVRLGAFYNNELVSVMTFSKPSRAEGQTTIRTNVFELSRFCFKTGYSVIGVASKLMNFFKAHYDYALIYSYADRRWSVGELYKTLGLALVGETSTNYWYIKNKKRIHRFSLRKKAHESKNITEWELRKAAGYDRIWDCGNLKYALKK